MNPPPALPNKRTRKESPWLWLPVAAILLTPVLLVAGIASYFHPSSDARALRDGIVKASGGEWEPVMVFNVGGFTTGAVRAGLSFAHLDAEPRAALQTVHGVEIGIYQLESGADTPDRAAMLASADTAMTGRGWDRVVGVMDGQALVGVYVPANIKSFSKLKCCVMVFDGKQMIVASARTNLQPLLTCIMEKPEVRSKLQLLAKR